MTNMGTSGTNAAQAEADRDQVVATLRARQNLALAVPAGIVAAIVGAGLWATFVYFTGTELGLIAIAVGALVGYAIRKTGHGVDWTFGVLGGACAAFGWALGTILADVALLAKNVDEPLRNVLTRLSPHEIIALAMQAADGMDLLFLAIAVWEGYRLSFRIQRR
jgi:hypothetical protein